MNKLWEYRFECDLRVLYLVYKRDACADEHARNAQNLDEKHQAALLDAEALRQQQTDLEQANKDACEAAAKLQVSVSHQTLPNIRQASTGTKKLEKTALEDQVCSLSRQNTAL